MRQTGISRRNAGRRQRNGAALELVTADDHRPRPAAARAISGLAGVETIIRYSMAWPFFVTREALAGYDDLLAFALNVILGEDWEAGGLDQVDTGGGPRRAGPPPA